MTGLDETLVNIRGRNDGDDTLRLEALAVTDGLGSLDNELRLVAGFP